MGQTAQKHAHLFFQALDSELGIVVKTDQPQAFIWRLQGYRRELNNPAFDVLVIAVSRRDPTGEVWIVKQSQDPQETTDAPKE